MQLIGNLKTKTMNSKKYKIKEAYGKNYNPHNIDENGWMGYNLWIHFFKKVDDDYDEFDNRNMRVRPNSLTGIENNAGWIKIESEDDLPKDYDSLYDVCNNQNVDTIPMTLYQVKYLYDNKMITHYQKHNKKLPPLY